MPPANLEDYAYAYGVVCGKYSKLFDYRIMENFIESRSISDIIASLESTEYEGDISGDLRKEATTLPLELALKKHFMKIYEEIASTMPENDMDMFDTIIAEELNVKNMKIILRAIHSGMKQDRLMQLLGPSKKDDAKFFRELSKSGSIEEFISCLKKTPYHKELSRRMEDYKKFGHLLPLEAGLDKVLIERWRRYMVEDDDIKNFVRAKIDVINIRNVIKCKAYDIPLQEHIFDDGLYLSKLVLGPMVGGDMGDIIKLSERTIYADVVREAIEKYKETGSLTHLDVGLEKIVMDLLENTSKFNPLSISNIVSFMNLKWKEVKNLITIIICKSYDMPPKEIKELMI